MKTVIIRHRRENRKKCTLRPLESDSAFLFLSYPLRAPLPPLDGYCVLAMDGPPLSPHETYHLLLLDGTWRYAEKMARILPPDLPRRSLPPALQTAYPRRQDDCPDPTAGLASIEALFAAFHIMGKPTDGLLDAYYWRAQFLEKNAHLLLDLRAR